MGKNPTKEVRLQKIEVATKDHCRFIGEIVNFEMQMHIVRDTHKIQGCLDSALNDRWPFLRCPRRVNMIFFDLWLVY